MSYEKRFKQFRDDIRSMNVEDLSEQKTDLDIAITDIQLQLEEDDFAGKESREQADGDWKFRAEVALKAKKLQMRMVQEELGKRRRDAEKSQRVASRFLEVAREELPEPKFTDLYATACADVENEVAS